jgi:xylan 1,4-beta-xylosidase
MNRIGNGAALILLLFVVAQCAGISSAKKTDSKAATIYLADPSIYQQSGIFYLYGTVEGRSGDGFRAYTSTDLKEWKLAGNNNGYVLRKGDAFGTAGFWAPQVFPYGGKFYMAYVANENIALAESGSPAGPFTQATKEPLAAPVKQIDPFVFIDDDGKKYLYHVRLAGGNKIFVAQLKDDLSGIRPETLKECITATDEWENTARAEWPVAEGPSVLKHKGMYYLLYTANDFRNPDYAVGYANRSW